MSVSITKRDREWAKRRLAEVKPFDAWIAEGPRSAADQEMYHMVVSELQKMAGVTTLNAQGSRNRK